MTLASPCVGICKLDETTGWCIGCARTGDEIADWRSRNEAARKEVWDELPARFEALGVSCRRLPWSTDEIRDFVVQSLQSGRGAWVAGVVGAVAEFTPKPHGQVTTRTSGDTVIAQTDGGALRFCIDDSVRALTFESATVPLEKARIVLAVKRERGRPGLADALTALGLDIGAIHETDRQAALFDMGLGRKEARFTVRCTPGRAFDALTGALGTTFPANMAQIGPGLLAKSPTRVVETALGRIEVSAPIPAPGGTSPSGPHTHLLPDHLATKRALPPGMDLPRAYLPGAVFYPQH